MQETKETEKDNRITEKINVRKAIDKLRWLLNENFTGGDMHIRLSYAGTKPDYDQMKEDKAKFLRKLRAEFKKQEKELKFVHVFEIGKRGARHHHLVINSIDSKTLRECWPHGSVYVSLLDDTGQYGEAGILSDQRSNRKRRKTTEKIFSIKESEDSSSKEKNNPRTKIF
ncbi:MAG: hypothetical protein ACLS54_02985 [Anaerostipes hadrus]